MRNGIATRKGMTTQNGGRVKDKGQNVDGLNQNA